jgi:hypothetical protein
MWASAPDGSRRSRRGIYRATLDGMPGCEGSGPSVNAAIAALAEDLRSWIDQHGCEYGSAAHDVARLASEGRLDVALRHGAGQPILVEELRDL